jgi:hypothetical protein
MEKIVRNNLIVALSYLCIWLIVDIIDVKWHKIPGYKYELIIILSVVLLSFVFANRTIFKKLKPLFRGVAIFAVSIGLTAIWFLITTTILGEFHLSIGGSL